MIARLWLINTTLTWKVEHPKITVANVNGYIKLSISQEDDILTGNCDAMYKHHVVRFGVPINMSKWGVKNLYGKISGNIPYIIVEQHKLATLMTREEALLYMKEGQMEVGEYMYAKDVACERVTYSVTGSMEEIGGVYMFVPPDSFDEDEDGDVLYEGYQVIIDKGISNYPFAILTEKHIADKYDEDTVRDMIKSGEIWPIVIPPNNKQVVDNFIDKAFKNKAPRNGNPMRQ